MIRLVLLLSIFASAALADPVQDWIAAQDKDHRPVLSSILEDETLQAYLNQCPADVFPNQRRRAKGNKSCSDNPVWCLTLCRGGQGDACFGVARAIQTEMDDVGEATFTYPMFMAGCADGNANSCTNAGAGAKNGTWIDGTFPAHAARARLPVPHIQGRLSRWCQLGVLYAGYGMGV